MPITALLSCGLGAQQFKPQQIAFFEKKVRPLLAKHCFECHSTKSKNLEGDLRLDHREGFLQGGASGKPVALPGSKLGQTRLFQVVRLKQVGKERTHPPLAKPLSLIEIKSLAIWVQMKLPFPKARNSENIAKKTTSANDWKKKFDWTKASEFWAFRNPVSVQPPETKDKQWPQNDIDRFILAKLEKAGLKPVGEATKRTFIRRLYFDLIGLPPSPDAVNDFLRDKSTEALEKVVDQLLASRHFGERWGRHWLDVARYGESTGMERNFTYPQAWRYRDYVIASFNKDKPYNLFIKEQIAGDLMTSQDASEQAERLVATGFLALGPKSLNQRNKDIFMMDMVDEQIDVATRATLGLSVSCARCHDHKFDPIPTEDYYAIAGIFRSTKTFYGTSGGNGNRQAGALLPMGKNAKSLKAALDTHRQEVSNLGKQLKKAQKELNLLKKKKGDADIASEMEKWREEIREKNTRLKQLRENSPQAPEYAMGVQDLNSPQDVRVHLRGDVDTLGELVPRGYLTVLKVPEAGLPPTGQSGRLQLAEWLTHEENPLSSRVIVNRIWHHLFGQGIVRTVDNFGSSGEEPSHLEMLDYLAIRFREKGWSIKETIKEIVLSRTYRLSSDENQKNFEVDSENRLLWRANTRRLQAEAIRDAILTASGQIDLEPVKGSIISKVGNGNIGRGVNIPKDSMNNATHRSVYLPIARNFLPEFLRTFDFAEPSMIVGRRQETTVPAQALFLLNSPFVSDQAIAMAKSILKKSVGSPPERLITTAYERTLSRQPTNNELSKAIDFHQNEIEQNKETSQEEALARFCHALFASAEFRYFN